MGRPGAAVPASENDRTRGCVFPFSLVRRPSSTGSTMTGRRYESVELGALAGWSWARVVRTQLAQTAKSAAFFVLRSYCSLTQSLLRESILEDLVCQAGRRTIRLTQRVQTSEIRVQTPGREELATAAMLVGGDEGIVFYMDRKDQAEVLWKHSLPAPSTVIHVTIGNLHTRSLWPFPS